jgi:hypothetical protein
LWAQRRQLLHKADQPLAFVPTMPFYIVGKELI